MSASLFMRFKNFIAHHYGNAPAKMLVHTGIIGWIMSSAAQIGAIAINDKLTPKQKMFLIPQEFADACVNIASFYLITSSMKDLSSALVKNGKWSTKSIKQFLSKRRLKPGSNIDISEILSNSKQTKAIKNLTDEFVGFKDGMDVIATTLGSVISCNIVTPLVRNQYASKRQKSSLARMQEYNDSNKKSEFSPVDRINIPKINDFASGNLKI